MDYFLNELSVKEAEDLRSAKFLMEQFVQTCIRVRTNLRMDVLRIPEYIGKNLYDVIIFNGYPLAKWISDSEVNFDLRERFRQIIATPPLFKNTEFEEYDKYIKSTYYTCDAQNEECRGLGISTIFDSLSISFQTELRWRNHEIQIKHQYFNTYGEIREENLIAKHSSEPSHVANHEAYFEKQRNLSLRKCAEIWNDRIQLFPNLVFCVSTQRQLRRGLSSKFVHQIVNRLNELDEYAATWTHGEFDYRDFSESRNVNCTLESKKTMDLYGDERRFSLPNGRKEYFELHIKTGDLRFHFFPDPITHTVYIGYIGHHLNIASEK